MKSSKCMPKITCNRSIVIMQHHDKPSKMYFIYSPTQEKNSSRYMYLPNERHKQPKFIHISCFYLPIVEVNPIETW